MARLTRLCFEDLCSEIPETFSKEEILALIAGLENVAIEVVDNLPQEGETNVIYLVPNDGEEPNIYDEYVWIYDADTDTGIFELIGSTKIDLAQYYTKAEIDALFDGKQDTLVSGENIKTINGESLPGSGNIEIAGRMTKDEILAVLGYEETNLTITGEDGTVVDRTMLIKKDEPHVIASGGAMSYQDTGGHSETCIDITVTEMPVGGKTYKLTLFDIVGVDAGGTQTVDVICGFSKEAVNEWCYGWYFPHNTTLALVLRNEERCFLEINFETKTACFGNSVISPEFISNASIGGWQLSTT